MKTAVGYIERTPGTCGGKPRIAGTRIRVQDVVILHEDQGLSPDEILQHFPHLTLGQIYTALAYYFDHVAEIRKEIADDDAFFEQYKRDHPEESYENFIARER